MSTDPEDPALQESLEEVWYLKEINFQPTADSPSRTVKIVTQNFNGPCSFIAICNILILRGHIEIQPPERTTVSYDFLSQLVGEYLLTSSPDDDTSAALSVMPVTRKGMDLNPLFTGLMSFRPGGSGGELKLFEQAGIQLVHGWLADPDTHEFQVLAKTEDYDTSVNLIVEADFLTKGKLVAGNNAPASPGADTSGVYELLTDEERHRVQDAIIIRDFLDRTQSQLTYHGLFTLASVVQPGTLVALFRNSHLSVLYKPTSESDGGLYTLVTDQVFLHESSVVWERLEDVDGGMSSFVDSNFVRSSPAGGDYAGHTGESALAALEAEAAALSLGDSTDQELARQLQAEEDERAREIYAQRERARERELALRAQREEEARRALHSGRSDRDELRKAKKKGDCVIM
ncbi:uncharacterized protein FIBRA_08884 [Fibroporia radiculosa]|uniref:MINDY deubiquitinase domain-containing protein n=1 Tax=Fibroporia radiculosa TaxID=599839 RepID=J4GXK3_9APHY|nr:uncharacterized protein FIBRA_08884 [Fibroporia radiculosa]CCM06605.1 predicted protein [Fibroporia radiculosa]